MTDLTVVDKGGKVLHNRSRMTTGTMGESVKLWSVAENSQVIVKNEDLTLVFSLAAGEFGVRTQ